MKETSFCQNSYQFVSRFVLSRKEFPYTTLPFLLLHLLFFYDLSQLLSFQNLTVFFFALAMHICDSFTYYLSTIMRCAIKMHDDFVKVLLSCLFFLICILLFRDQRFFFFQFSFHLPIKHKWHWLQLPTYLYAFQSAEWKN